jgi:serine/threonine protein kinase
MALPLVLTCGAVMFASLASLFRKKSKTSKKKQNSSTLLTPGTLVEHRHQILECVGEGGLGIVYGAQDTRLHRPVAIKFVRNEHRKDPQVEEQFFKEAIHASQINHPNIVTIYDYGYHENQPFIVMEFLNGYTLDEYKLRPADDWQTFSSIALQILEALEVAHEARLFHGDIKPTNIMVVPSRTRTPPNIKIFDFGLSRILKIDLKQFIDGETVFGSIHYMAPEQFRGDLVDGRTDLYSAGVIFYQLLSGSLPFEADHGHALIEKIVLTEPIPLRHKNSRVPAYLDSAIMKLIDKDPAKRFQTAAEAKATFRPFAYAW